MQRRIFRREGPTLKARYAVILSLALALVFTAAAVFCCFSGRGSTATISAAPVSESAVLTGNDTPGLTPVELLPGETININTADAEELTRLSGIGDSLAAAIIEYREANGPFAAPEDIQNVPGIGEKKFAAIQEYITTGD